MCDVSCTYNISGQTSLYGVSDISEALENEFSGFFEANLDIGL